MCKHEATPNEVVRYRHFIDTRSKISKGVSAAKKGKPFSAEHCAALSKALLGKSHNYERRNTLLRGNEAEVLEAYENGTPTTVLAARYKCSRSHIYKILEKAREDRSTYG